MNDEVAAFVEMSENSPAKADLLKKRAIDAGDAVMNGVDQNVALHSGQHFLHA